VTLHTERLAREIVRADIRARAATRLELWDEAWIWVDAREELRALRSNLMRQQLITGEWWGAPPQQDVA
jgi:hypothetical protein